ncbi:MAG: hypothetical protein ACR2KQ_00890 [Actinomycetota bacterium]
MISTRQFIKKIPVSWGILDQALSSATNFGLTILAGRILGPVGLGVVAVGFAAHLFFMVLHRALVTQPLVVSSSDTSQRAVAATRAALTTTLVIGAISTVIMFVAGALLGGPTGLGLKLFSFWMAPAMVQDLWRGVLFRDGRGRAAAANDGVWLIGMLIALPVSLAAQSDWVVVATWGFGATAGALLGLVQTRIGFAAPSMSREWWLREAWPFGRWLAVEGFVYSAGLVGMYLLLSALLGPAAIGGIRAAQVLFAPLTLLGPALGLPGLPALSRALRTSAAEARVLAAKLSTLLAGATLAYLLLVGFADRSVLEFVYGRSFGRYGFLVWPMGTAQVITAVGAGALLLLRAARASGGLMISRLTTTGGTLLLVGILAGSAGIVAAAWGAVAAAAMGTAVALWITARADLTPRSSAGGTLATRLAHWLPARVPAGLDQSQESILGATSTERDKDA